MQTTLCHLGLVQLRADVAPATIREAERTVDVSWYTGAEVVVYPWFEEPFVRQLGMQPGQVRLGRLQSGNAPLLNSHSSSDLSHVIGVIESAWIENGVGRARVRFSDRVSVAEIWSDVKNGVLRNVSVGGRIHKLEEQRDKRTEEMRFFLATDWEPIEISLVAAGADPRAVVHSEERGLFPCEVMMEARKPRTEERVMPENIEESTALGAATPREVNERATRAERERASGIEQVAQALRLTPEFARQHVDSGTSLEAFRMLGINKAAEASAVHQIDGRLAVGIEHGAPGEVLDSMAAALAARARGAEPEGPARRYANLTLVECAYESLRLRGSAPRGLDPRRHPHRVIEQTHSTSDFPGLLANVANKLLLPAYAAAPVAYRQLCLQRDMRDFKETSILRRGDFPTLLQVGEGGEIKLGTLSEKNEKLTLATYARRFSLTRAALVNDDLGAFNDLVTSAARRVADYENALFFSVLTSASGAGPTLADGVALFHATHGNLDSASAIDITSLSSGRSKIMKQTSLDGLKISIAPRYLLVSPDKLTIAQQFVSQLTPATASAANPFSGALIVIGDANLSGNAWYLFAEPSALPTFIYGHLEGDAGPRIEARQGWEVEGLEFKCAVDFVVGPVDYRGVYRNPGA